MSADGSKPGRVAPIELESAAIRMRPYCDDDAPLLFTAAIESIETVGRWMPWCHAEYAKTDSIAWVERSRACWQSGEEYSFALFDRKRDYIGGAGSIISIATTISRTWAIGYVSRGNVPGSPSPQFTVWRGSASKRCG
jgi:hypothetical protein